MSRAHPDTLLLSGKDRATEDRATNDKATEANREIEMQRWGLCSLRKSQLPYIIRRKT